ncbi:MAG: NAD(+)/NADH kinase [Oscillospiraceae bacterium]|nr:NAD(+)/NADH kinase [Oscillospiraceae bacterium]
MKFLIKVNLSKDNSITVTREVIRLFIEENYEYRLCKEPGIENACPYRDVIIPFKEGLEWCDVIVTIGGDGTLLAIGKDAAKLSKPIVGINAGRIGFLTAIEGNDVSLLSKLDDKSVFEIKKHNFIQARINKGPWQYCLNDVVLSKCMYSNTVDLSIFSNGEQLMRFSGDGIILATSTGSTAYSLSVGGPIVDSDLQAMVISPVAPHSLNRTSMVLAKNKHISIKANDRNKNLATIAFDGTGYTEVGPEDTVEVKLSSKYVSIYTLRNQGQFEKVDKKLKSR